MVYRLLCSLPDFVTQAVIKIQMYPNHVTCSPLIKTLRLHSMRYKSTTEKLEVSPIKIKQTLIHGPCEQASQVLTVASLIIIYARHRRNSTFIVRHWWFLFSASWFTHFRTTFQSVICILYLHDFFIPIN